MVASIDAVYEELSTWLHRAISSDIVLFFGGMNAYYSVAQVTRYSSAALVSDAALDIILLGAPRLPTNVGLSWTTWPLVMGGAVLYMTVAPFEILMSTLIMR